MLWEAVRLEQSKDGRPGTEGHQGGKPQMLGKGQNWENKDLASREFFPPLAHHSSHALDPPLTFPPLACCWPCRLDTLRGGTNRELKIALEH